MREIKEHADDCGQSKAESLCLLEIADRRVRPAAPAEADDGMEELPNRAGWIYPDEPNSAKIFAEVDAHNELDYRQKTQLESAINTTLAGDLKELSWAIERDEKVRNAFADIMKKNGIEVTMGTDPEFKGFQMTMNLPDAKERLVFGWRGGLTPVYGITEDGTKVTTESVNNAEENPKVLNQVFSRLIHQFRLDYMEASQMRSGR